MTSATNFTAIGIDPTRAQLRAAAPDLLAALTGLLSALPPTMRDSLPAEVARAEAAIDAATRTASP